MIRELTYRLTCVAAAALLTTSVFMLGCGDSANNTSTPIGFVDLDMVAEQVGRAAELATQVQQAQQSLQAQLGEMEQQLTQQLQSRRQEMGEEPSQEQIQAFMNMQRQAQQTLQQESMNAQQEMERLRATMIGQFRDEVAPYVREIATRRGMQVVMITNEGLILYKDQAADLTDELINRMRGGQGGTAGPVEPAAPAQPQNQVAP